MEIRPFIDTPEKGIKRWFLFDHARDEFTIQTQFTVPVEENKLLYNLFDERTRWRDGGEVVARIPDTILLQLKRDGILDDQKKFRAWLNDRDNKVFRTRPGRV
jgi:hypothetical protein